jgi:hypothetical protein
MDELLHAHQQISQPLLLDVLTDMLTDHFETRLTPRIVSFGFVEKYV